MTIEDWKQLEVLIYESLEEQDPERLKELKELIAKMLEELEKCDS